MVTDDVIVLKLDAEPDPLIDTLSDAKLEYDASDETDINGLFVLIELSDIV